MPAPTGTPEFPLGELPSPQIVSLRWALRRAALGLLALLIAVALVAWLFYASIDPDEAAAGAPAQDGVELPQR